MGGKGIPDNYKVREAKLGTQGERQTISLFLMIAGLAVIVGSGIEKICPSNEFTAIGKMIEVIWVLLGAVAVVILHELAHYIGYKLYGCKPYATIRKVKGFGWCPAVGIREGVCTKVALIFTGLCPQILTMVCVILGLQMSAPLGRVLLLAGFVNLVGGIGDYQAVYYVLKSSRNALFGDSGDGLMIYEPVGSRG